MGELFLRHGTKGTLLNVAIPISSTSCISIQWC